MATPLDDIEIARLLADDEPARPAHPALVLPPAQLAGRIQHALLGQAITEAQVVQHIEETLTHGFDAAFVPPVWATRARREMNGHGRIGAIVDYPHGTSTGAGRIAEVKSLIDAGVDELDATVNIGYLLSSRIAEFAEDLRQLVAAAAPIGIKVMLELPLLNVAQRAKAVQAAVDAGVAFVENASRGGIGIADAATISYLRGVVPSSVGVKATGGIKTIEQVRSVLVAGADLVGTAAGVQIITGRGHVPGSLYSY